MRSAIFFCSVGILLGGTVNALGGAGGPLSVTVTLRGKKYEVKGASTVADVQRSLEDQAGLAKEQQSVLFKGSLLKPEAGLGDAGISDGDTVNVVPSKKPKPAATTDHAGEVVKGKSENRSAGKASGSADPFGLGGLGDMGGFGGLGGALGMPPGVTPEQYQKMMKEMINSNMMEEVLGNAEKMEQARQAILANPTLKQAMSQLPGFSEMIDSPEKWREQMEMALEMFKAQKAIFQKQEGTADDGAAAADVDDLDDD